ncbi:uncharacterized protein LOC135470721 [Liolophura sinensis]|uniref:uncharacterized protein LOC135470721 n=1 Tax=Liolophura sinensis TaxID=3198878 RepID=UPI003158871A
MADSKSSLTNLYNSKVVTAEKMQRPLQGSLGLKGVPHQGVRVTTESGDQWLVHKTKGQGSSDTVVTDARHMSSAWNVVDKKDISGGRSVGDYVAAGGTKYNVVTNNCLDATRRMMQQ